MSGTPLIELDGVGFTYSTGIGFYSRKKVEALRDVSFTVRSGETIGLIGRNGCGKSTLFRILAGIFRPDRGSLVRHCDRVSLLALNVGFDPNLSGADNLIISCMFLGASRREARSMFEEIVEFSELEEFIDEPLKTYSSGMVARLGFSVGLKMKADLLLIDEVLGVGDAAFREKATKAMKQRINSDQAVILASHADSTILELCERVIWLENGAVRQQGEPAAVLKAYRQHIRSVKGVGRPVEQLPA
ncbi:MAG: ABC transporter ATP-binding protein [Xanthomonadales bacterium]|nr:ABC transporter ATP-binding protein [Xanthomonadales bacterium]